MKKILATLLALALLCVSFAVAETAAVVATLYTVGVSQDGENWMDPSVADIDMYFVFRDDGTFDLNQNGEVAGSGTYTEQENSLTLTVDGDELVMTADANGDVVADLGGIYIKLSMTPSAGVETAAAVTASSAEEFNGKYNASVIDAFGMKVDMATIAATGQLDQLLGDMSDLSMTIDNGTVTVFGKTEDGFVLENGALVMRLEGFESLDQTIGLTETGVVYTVMGMSIYFDRVE